MAACAFVGGECQACRRAPPRPMARGVPLQATAGPARPPWTPVRTVRIRRSRRLMPPHMDAGPSQHACDTGRHPATPALYPGLAVITPSGGPATAVPQCIADAVTADHRRPPSRLCAAVLLPGRHGALRSLAASRDSCVCVVHKHAISAGHVCAMCTECMHRLNFFIHPAPRVRRHHQYIRQGHICLHRTTFRPVDLVGHTSVAAGQEAGVGVPFMQL